MNNWWKFHKQRRRICRCDK